MKRTKLMILLLTCFIPFAFMEMKAQASFNFNHGPYLMGLTTTGTTVFFSTNKKALSWVEVKNNQSETISSYFDTAHGLKQANNCINRVRIDNLNPGTQYK